MELVLPLTMEGLRRSSTFFTDSMGIPEHHNSEPRPRPIPRPTSRTKTNIYVGFNNWNVIPAQIVMNVHGSYRKEIHYKY